MKKRTLLIPVLTLVCCLCLIAGATFALFESKSNSNIAITSGQLNVEASLSERTTYSKGEPTEVNGEFENNGTAQINEDKSGLSIERISPGDKVVVKIDITNSSNINYMQRITLGLGSGSEDFYGQLLLGVSNDGSEYEYFSGYSTEWVGYIADPSGAPVTSSMYVSIELPEYVNSNWQGQNCDIAFAVEVVQGNADIDVGAVYHRVYRVTDQTALDEALGKMQNGDTVILDGGAANWTTANISYEGDGTIYVRGYKVGTLTIYAPNGTVHYYNDTGEIIGQALADSSLHVYGRIGSMAVTRGRAVVESSASVDAVEVMPTESGAEAKVEIKQNAEVQAITSQPAQDSTATIIIEENTVIPVLTVEGEGETKLDNSGIVEDTQGGGELIEGAVSFESFVAKLAAGGDVSLATDIGVYADPSLSNENVLVPLLTINKDTRLNLNGYKIYVEYEKGVSYAYTPSIFSIDGADVVIEGNGTIDAEAGNNNSYGINLINGASLTINDGTYYGAITAVQVSSGELTVNGGFFDLAETCKAAVPEYAKYVINCIDDSFKNGTAKIFVKGGTFVNFDPSDNPEGAGTTYVAEGYEAIPAQAGDETHYTVQPLWDGVAVDTSWYNEEDTQFTLNSAMQLAGLASLVNGGNDFAGKTITLGADIDLNGKEWTPIGNGYLDAPEIGGNSFAGTFDGQGFTISNLSYDGDGYAASIARPAFGLFGVVTGTVQDFTLVNVSINATGCESVGAVAGAVAEGGKISGVTVESGTIAGGDGVGGIVGRMVIEGTIENCTNNAAVDSSDGKAGGITSVAYYTRQDKVMNIIDCANSGEITSTAGYVGGIVGMSSGNVNGCTNTGSVTGNGTGIGGIVGEQQNYGIVSGNTNEADITNNSNGFGTGGIVGWVRYSGSDTDYQMKAMIEVTGNRNSGSVAGGTSAGGIVGHMYNVGLVRENVNTAAAISSSNFAAGIVGSLQFADGNTYTEEQCDIQVSYNVSTTPVSSISGNCVDQYAYNNRAHSGSEDFVVEHNFASEAEMEGMIIHAADEESFKAALGSVKEGGLILLEADIGLVHVGTHPDSTVDTYIAVPDVTIDLQNHTITVTNNGDYCVFGLAADGITLKNGTITLADTENTGYPLFVTSNAQNVVIENVAVIGGIQVLGTSTVTLKDVDITATTWYCVYLEGSTCQATIESGEFIRNETDNRAHFYTAGRSNRVIINGGLFDGTTTPVTAGNGTFVDNINVAN